MGDVTKIQWELEQFVPAFDPALIADTVGLVVFQFVTWMAKSCSIVNNKAEFRVCRKWLLMVGAKVSTLGISALLTGELVASEHGKPPCLVFGRATVTEVSLCLAVTKGVVITAPWSAGLRDGTDFSQCLRCVLRTHAMWIRLANMRQVHFQLGGFCVRSSIECGDATTERCPRSWREATRFAFRAKSIATTSVNDKMITWHPRLAFNTSLFPAVTKMLVFRDGHSESSRNNLKNASLAAH